MKSFLMLCLVFLTELSYAQSYQEIDRQRRQCEKMGDAAAIGYKYKKDKGYLEALIYIVKKKKPDDGRVIPLDEAQIYEPFIIGINNDSFRREEDAYMAGWSWCMDGMPMK